MPFCTLKHPMEHTTQEAGLGADVGGTGSIFLPFQRVGRFEGTKEDLTSQVHLFCNRIGADYRLKKSDRQKVHYVCDTAVASKKQQKADSEPPLSLTSPCPFNVKAGFHSKDGYWYITPGINTTHTCIHHRQPPSSDSRKRKRSSSQAMLRAPPQLESIVPTSDNNHKKLSAAAEKQTHNTATDMTQAQAYQIPNTKVETEEASVPAANSTAGTTPSLAEKAKPAKAPPRERKDLFNLNVVTYDGWKISLPRVSRHDRVENLLASIRPPGADDGGVNERNSSVASSLLTKQDGKINVKSISSSHAHVDPQDHGVKPTFKLCFRFRNEELTSGRLQDYGIHSNSGDLQIIRCVQFSVRLASRDNQTVPVLLPPTDTVSVLKERLVGLCGINPPLRPHDFRIHQANPLTTEDYLEDRETLAHCNVTHGTVLYAEICFSVRYRLVDSNDNDVGGLEVFRGLTVFGTDAVPTVKRMIRAREGIPAKQLELSLDDKVLEDASTLSDYGVTSLSVLSVRDIGDAPIVTGDAQQATECGNDANENGEKSEWW